MDLSVFTVVEVSSLRQTLTVPGDIRSELAFRNDVDALLVRIEAASLPFRPEANLIAYSTDWLERDTPRARLALPTSIGLGRAPARRSA